MSFIKRNRPGRGWRSTVGILLTVLLSTANSPAQEGRSRPRISGGPTFRLAGRHTFTIASVRRGDVIEWEVDREETPEEGGASTLTTGIAKAHGPSASFDLPKISGWGTTYYIHARGHDFNDTQRVQVFPAGARTSFLYRGRGNPDVRTYICLPPTLSPATKIVVVMAGQQRDAHTYID